MRRTFWAMAAAILAATSFGYVARTAVEAQSTQAAHAAAPIPSGATHTRLPDGRALVIGGQIDGRPVGTAAIVDPSTGRVQPLRGRLTEARWGHSATVLPDGSVLIVGGIGPDGSALASPERLTLSDETFTAMTGVDLTGRAHHTATLLTDGRVLIAGGVDEGGRIANAAQLWDPATSRLEAATGLLIDRRDHEAILLPDGTVLLSGGQTARGDAPDGADIFDPVTNSAFAVTTQVERTRAGWVEATPAEGSTVPSAVRFALRFGVPLLPSDAASTVMRLQGPGGAVPIRVVVAESGRLLWITPEVLLTAGDSYVLTVESASMADGTVLPPLVLHYSVAREEGKTPHPEGAATQDGAKEASIADAAAANSSPWRSMPPLRAPDGVTALAGQALRTNGQPLADVTLEIDEISTRTDRTGRFLLSGVPAGHHELIIDGTSAASRDRKYGVYEVGVDIVAGRTTVLPYTIWMTALDTAHEVTIPSPTTGELVITTPRIPGLEVRLPAGAVITDRLGQTVTKIGITPIPIDRPPFPLPIDLDVPTYFTVQPGGAYIHTPPDGPRGARLIYPNPRNYPLGHRIAFWHYDPEERGWYVYGQGAVMGQPRQIVPDPGVTVYEFTGAMAADPFFGSPEGPQPSDDPNKDDDADPVDLGTGLFILRQRDLFIRDVLPIELTRTYRPRDTRSRAFGVGTTHDYEMFLVGATRPWTLLEVVLPDGGRVTYPRISPGGSFSDGVFEHMGSPSRFQGSRITWNGNGWNLRLRDGTLYQFPDGEFATRPGQSALIGVRDRNGNAMTLRRDDAGRLLEIVSPHGRWIRLTYDAAARITRADDNGGRFVTYTYDVTGRLTDVRDAGSGVTTYTYDTAHRMLTIRDPRNNVYLTNEYDTAGRVFRQTLGDTGAYQLAYTTDSNGRIVQTDVTDPRGFVRRVTFDGSGYMLSDTRAFGQPEEQTTTYVRDPSTHRVMSVTDALNRQTTYTYDGLGNLLTETRLAGTGNAVTTTYTYEPGFNQVASVTDPLNHTWTFGYDARGNLTSTTDPLSHTQTMTHDETGRILTITDPLSHVTRFAYAGGDLAQVTDPAGETTTMTHDQLGRVVATTDPLGRRSASTYDALDRAETRTDAIGGTTTFSYDPNDNLLALTDALTHSTSFTYDVMDRLFTRTDPALQTETTIHDLMGNVSRHTDRKGQVTTFGYDGLGRRTFAGFGTVGTPPSATYEGTVTTTFDKGNRVVTLADSQAGTIQRTYDGLDRLLTETTPQGGVTYTYDTAGRRTSFTVTGQPAVTYTYDNANRLQTIQQGSTMVSYTYDAANRRISVTLPNGILVETGYDAASRVTSLTYRVGANVLGDLTYTYNSAGERVEIGGSFARTGLPAAVASAVYDAANRVTTFGGALLTHDLNGNLMSDGATTYTWDARNRLVTEAGPGLTGAFEYDAEGRRIAKTINGATTVFLYDRLNAVQESSGSTASANLLTGLGIDEHLSRDAGSGAYTYLMDALGSTVALTSPAGTLDTDYTYEPFGALTVSGAATTNTFTFTGREQDSAGLRFHRSRYYDSGLQRFISEDPKGFLAGGASLYEYAGTNPLLFVDRCGTEKENCSPSAGTVAAEFATCVGITSAAWLVVIESVVYTACAFAGPGGLAACVLAMHHAILPATINYEWSTWSGCAAYAYWRYHGGGCK